MGLKGCAEASTWDFVDTKPGLLVLLAVLLLACEPAWGLLVRSCMELELFLCPDTTLAVLLGDGRLLPGLALPA